MSRMSESLEGHLPEGEAEALHDTLGDCAE